MLVFNNKQNDTRLDVEEVRKIQKLNKSDIQNLSSENINTKGMALKHFSKTEIIYLFFVPFLFVSIYISILWHLFK